MLELLLYKPAESSGARTLRLTLADLFTGPDFGVLVFTILISVRLWWTFC